MNRFLGTLIVVGVVVWIFLMWEKSQPPRLNTGEFEDATRSERCAEFRSEIDGENWSLGYGGRIRQIVRGCF